MSERVPSSSKRQLWRFSFIVGVTGAFALGASAFAQSAPTVGSSTAYGSAGQPVLVNLGSLPQVTAAMILCGSAVQAKGLDC